MSEKQVQDLRKREKELIEEQERIQKELVGLRKPGSITGSSDEEFEQVKNEKIQDTDSEISEIEDSFSEIKQPCITNTDSEIDDNLPEIKNPCTNTNTFLSHKKTKRLVNSKLDDVPLKKRQELQKIYMNVIYILRSNEITKKQVRQKQMVPFH